MAGNTLGHIFRVTTFGESHGPAMGAVVEGCPAGLELSVTDLWPDLDRRRPGQHELTSPRKEPDTVEILSGVFEGKTLGTPIALLIRNWDARPKDYEALKGVNRPGHADATWEAKYAFRDHRGGGRASARETAARVAAGAVARKLLSTLGVKITGSVKESGDVKAAKAEGDSVGGIVEVTAHGVPAGWGEPVFHKLSSDLAAALMSIPAARGVELGGGFASARLRGSENNKKSDGILGGISTGHDIVARFALKPPSSLGKTVKGRHDPCVCERAVPVGEAMMALVLADHYLLSRLSRL